MLRREAIIIGPHISDLEGEFYIAGIDAGGTKCRARVETISGELIGNGLAGPSNLNLGAENAQKEIYAALKEACNNKVDFKNLIIGIGIAGSENRSKFNEFLTWEHPFAQLAVTTDALTALFGVHEGADGAVIILGTGTAANVLINNKLTVMGGYGFPIADHGSGASIGLSAIRKTMLTVDGIIPHSLLSRQVLRTYGPTGHDLVTSFLNARPTDFAQLAPLIFEAARQDDYLALDVIKDATRDVDLLIDRVAQLLPPRISLIGGLSAPIRQWLSKPNQQKISDPLSNPTQGAIHFARKLYKTPPVNLKQSKNGILHLIQQEGTL